MEHAPDGTHTVAQIALMQTAIFSLFAAHPDKPLLHAIFLANSNAAIDKMMQVAITDEAIAVVRQMQQGMLQQLR